jgi:uncharacterized protein DUF4349/putative zinc finger protein
MNTAVHEISPEEIMAHHDGELTADRDKEVAAHLESCSGCIVLADRLRSTSSVLESWRVISSTSLQPPDTASSSLPIEYSWQLLLNRRVILGLVALLSTISFVFFEITGTYRSTAGTAELQKATRVDINNYVPHEGKVAGGGGGGVSVDNAAVNSESQAEISDHIQSLPMNGRSYTGLNTLTTGVAPAAPMIARSIELQIIAKDFAAVRGELDSVLVRHQGYAATLSVSNTDNTARALSASLRIPAPQLVAALNELKSLGRVTGEAQSGEEVTSQHADLVARIKNSRETEIRLQDILRNRTGKVSDILEVEQEIARVRGEIEEMESELKTLNHRVDFATINLTINEEYKAKVSSGAPAVGIRLHNATVAGFQSAASSALGITLWLIEIMPSLLLWAAILGFPAWWLWRRTQRAFASAI